MFLPLPLPRIVLALTLLATLLMTLVVLIPATSAPASARTSIEGYASWQPATTCSPKAKPGARQLGRWLHKRYGGGRVSISRACAGSSSEHTEGRAVDWPIDATRKAGRQRAQQFLTRIRRTDRAGHADAVARRMGIMYVIWNDKMFAAWNQFEPEPYLSSSCKKRRSCSPTLRHRDHVHVSLTRRAGKARTSWYAARS